MTELEAEKGNELQIILKGTESDASNNSTTNTLHCESASKKRKGMKERLVTWGYFDKFTNDEGIKKARCKYCQEEYVANTKNSGTSNLLSHMIKCPNNPHKVDTSQQRLAFQPKKGGQTGDVSVIPWKFDQEACRKDLARMIIIDEQPFISVEKEGFRDFVRTLQPLFHVPSRTTVTRDCLEIYNEERHVLKRIFKESK